MPFIEGNFLRIFQVQFPNKRPAIFRKRNRHNSCTGPNSENREIDIIVAPNLRPRSGIKEIPGIQCDNDWGGSSKHKVHRTAYFFVLENIKITLKNVSGEARMVSIFM